MREAFKGVMLTILLSAVILGGVWVIGAAAHGLGYGTHHGYYYNPDKSSRTTVTGRAAALDPPFIGIETEDKKMVEVFAGPMMLWTDKSFELNEGDALEVEAAEVNGPWGKRLVALDIKNLTTGKTLNLEEGTRGFKRGSPGGYYCDGGYGMHGYGPHQGYF